MRPCTSCHLRRDTKRNPISQVASSERDRLYLAQYRKDHHDEIVRHNAEYYARNRLRIRAQQGPYLRSHFKAHPEIYRAKVNARRARIAQVGGLHSIAEWTDKQVLFACCCAYCGEKRPLERDHKVPLARGGTDDITNILPACRLCNASKGKLTATEFLAKRAA